VAALSLRDLAAQVGMRAPSLYTYFGSKNELLDAMFAQGMQAMADRMDRAPRGRDAHQTFRNRARAFVDAAAEDPVRYDLLFQRPIPDFAPSSGSLAIGLAHLAQTREMARAAGLRDDAAFDLFMATTRGLVTMQVANQPGGDRWVGLVDEAVDTFVARFAGSRRAARRRRLE
jgi:AcrR family transcriptional regulator